MAIKSEQLLEAAKKAGHWFVTRQTEMGNYIGAEKPDAKGIYADTHDVGCYYKSIHFLRATGEALAAARAMNYVVDNFMSPEGDFFNAADNRTSGSYTPNYCQLYPNMWLLRGAVGLDRMELTHKILDFMGKNRDAKNGGYYYSVNPSKKVVDSNATGYGIFCQLIGGDIKGAVQSGDLILRMLDEQPSTDRYYLRWTEKGGYETDFSHIPAKHHLYCVIESKEPAQAYWCWGWPMNGLIKLYGWTGEEKYLKGAIKIYDFLASCHQDAFHFTTAGKDGWGAAMLYRITGDKRYLKSAMSQMDFILGAQHKDGYMLGPGVKSFEEQPLRTTYDFTADFGSWLVGVAIELAGRE